MHNIYKGEIRINNSIISVLFKKKKKSNKV